MKHVVVTVFILLAAMSCYLLGYVNSAMSLIVLGCVLEAWFWIRALRSEPKQAKPVPLT